MKKFFLLLISGLIFCSWYAPVQAQETEEQLTGTATTAAQATENLKERINKVVEEKKDQVENTLAKLARQPQAFIGQVQRVNAEALTVVTLKDTRIIPIDDSVAVLKQGKPIEITTVAVDDWALVLGYREDDTFSPKRVLISSTPLRPPTYQVAIGTVEDISTKSITVIPRSGEPTQTLNIGKSTRYQDLTGAKVAATALSPDTQVIAIYTESQTDKTAVLIRLLAANEPTDE